MKLNSKIFKKYLISDEIIIGMGAGDYFKMDGGSKEYIMIFERNFINKFKESLSEKVNLSNYSWFNLGGNADYFFKPRDISHLKEFLKEANKKI